MYANPPLNEDLLVHFGVKGMKWGHRKRRPDEKERKETFGPNAERRARIVKGAVVVGGAVAVGLLLSKRGRIAATNAAVTNYAQQRTARAQAASNPFGKLMRDMRRVKAASVPSPNEMMADARMAGIRNQMFVSGNRGLTDRSWREAANFQRTARESTGAPSAMDVMSQVRERMGVA